MPIRFFAAVLTCFVVVGCSRADAGGEGVAAGAEQGAGTDAQPQVTGVMGFPWGTTYDSIVGARGAPVEERSEPEGVKAFRYDDRVLGRPMTAMFFVHPQHGLMRGGYAAPFSGQADCTIALQSLDNVVTRRYSTLPGEGRGVSDVTSEICESVVSGQAPYAKTWTDPANGARIMMAMVPGGTEILLVYSTPQADAWERRKNDARF